MSKGVLLISIAVGALIACAGTSTATPRASTARSCPWYTVTIKRTLGGQKRLYRNRIGPITAHGISCAASRSLIRRADHTNVQLFHYSPIGGWQCKIPLRPYGGPHWKTGYDCKRPGAHLAWEETLLSTKLIR